MRIIFYIAADWKNRKSGVYTFVRSFVQDWGGASKHKLQTVEYPVQQETRSYARQARLQAKTICTENKIRMQQEPVRMLAGYIRMLAGGIRCVWKERKTLQTGTVLALNDFGAEVRPIACRLIFPFSKIVLIAHTHPNLQNREIWVRRLFEKMCYWSCSRVVFNSYALKAMWELKLGRQIRMGVVIHHGMDVPEEYAVPAAYPPKVPGSLDVVCVGLFYRWKGQLALIEVWPEILSASPVPLRLVLVGDGACLQEAKARAQTLKLSEKQVVFCGFQKEGPDFFNGADIAIHYPIEPEAFGLVLLEAMGLGKPVIAPAHGGATEIVVDGETGVLVKPKVESRKSKAEMETAVCGLRSESEARLSLVEAVCRLAVDADLRARMGAAGRERVRAEFSVEKMLAGYNAVFRDVAGKCR